MSFVYWIVFGLIAGFIASKLVNRTGSGFIVDILVGVAGAVVGGFLFTYFGARGVTGFNLWSMFVAVAGASILLASFHALRRASA